MILTVTLFVYYSAIINASCQISESSPVDNSIFSSFVVHYIIEEKTAHSGKVSFHSDKQGHKYLALVSFSGH